MKGGIHRALGGGEIDVVFDEFVKFNGIDVSQSAGFNYFVRRG